MKVTYWGPLERASFNFWKSNRDDNKVQ